MSDARPNAIEHLLGRYPSLTACRDAIEAARGALIRVFENDGKLLLCGNGGSAADCEHLAGELLKGFERARPLPDDMKGRLAAQGREGELLAAKLQGALPAISLVGLPCLTSAFANDVEPPLAFAQLVSALGRPGDALLAISTSGRARNVVLAAHAARAVGMETIALTGRGGGDLAEVCQIVIDVPGETTAAVQEFHVPVYHALCRSVEDRFFAD